MHSRTTSSEAGALFFTVMVSEKHGTIRKDANGCDQRLATLREPHRRSLSRVRCIAWFDLITITGVQSNCNAKASIHP
jgi:hypothetical protein